MFGHLFLEKPYTNTPIQCDHEGPVPLSPHVLMSYVNNRNKKSNFENFNLSIDSIFLYIFSPSSWGEL